MIIMLAYFAVCFAKFYNVQERHLGTLFLPFIINGLKLDSEIRNTESYSSFRKTSRKL